MVARSLVSFVVIMALMAFVHAPWQVFALRAIQGLFAGYGADRDDDGGRVGAAGARWRRRSAGCRPRSGSARRWVRSIGGVLAQAVGSAPARSSSSALVLRRSRSCSSSFGYREPAAPSARGTGRRAGAAYVRVAAAGAAFHAVHGDGLRPAAGRSQLRPGPAAVSASRSALPRAQRRRSGAACCSRRRPAAAAVGNQATPLAAAARGRVAAAGAGDGVAGARSRRVVFVVAAPLGVLLRDGGRLRLRRWASRRRRSTRRRRTRCRPASRGVAFGYLTTAYLVGPGGQSGRRRAHRRAEHARGLRRRRGRARAARVDRPARSVRGRDAAPLDGRSR